MALRNVSIRSAARLGCVAGASAGRFFFSQRGLGTVLADTYGYTPRYFTLREAGGCARCCR